MPKVVVTGVKGGTGPSVVGILREAGYRVLGIDLKPCGFWEQDYRQLDLEDGAGVHDALAGAVAVVHFGSLPTDSWTTWETAYRNLALGGYHVLQAADSLWSYVDARDVATACLAWLQSDRTGFEAFNVAADDVCVATPTRQLLARFYPHISDLPGEFPDHCGLVNCRKLKTMLGWQPQFHWRHMDAESQSQGFPKTIPKR